MARTSKIIYIQNMDVNMVLDVVNQILTGNGYMEKMVGNEHVWAKGDGVIIKMQCFGVTFREDGVILQGWLKDAITGESDLTCFVASQMKKKMLQIMKEIEMVLV